MIRTFKKEEATFSVFDTDKFFYAGSHKRDKYVVELINIYDGNGGNLKICAGNQNYTEEFTKSEMDNPNYIEWLECDTASEKYEWITEQLKKQGK